MKKITIGKQCLLDYLNRASVVLSKNVYLPILSEMKVEVGEALATITTTDLDVTIRESLACSNDFNECFAFLLPVAYMKQVTSVIDAPIIEIEIEGSMASIKGYNDVYELELNENVDDFPKMEEVDEEMSIQLPNDIVKSLNNALKTSSNDELRPALTRVLIQCSQNKATVVSTNAHVLYTKSFCINNDRDLEVMVSAKVIKALTGLSDFELSSNSNHYSFETDNCMITGKHLDARFPDYNAIIPTIEPNVTFNRNELKSAIAKASISSDGAAPTIVFELNREEGKVFVSGNDTGRGRKSETTSPAIYDCKVEQIAFNHNLLSDLLTQSDSENIQMAISAPNRAATLTIQGDDSYLGLIMPVLIN